MKQKPLHAFGPSRSFLLFVTAIAGLLHQQSYAAAKTWDGGGADTNWGTAANWNANTLPVLTGADNLVFAGSVGKTNVNNLAADSTFSGLSFTNATTAGGAFSISGNRITLGGNISTSTLNAGQTAFTDSVGLAMIFTGNRTVTTGTSHNINLTGILSETGGSSGLTKNGTASLSLQGANTFTGGVQVNEGILNISNLGSIATASGINIAVGATVTVNNTSGVNNVADRISNSGTVTIDGGTFNFNNTPAAATNYSETIGAVSISRFSNTINSGQAVIGQTSTLTIGSLSRTVGTTLNFTGAGLGSTTDARNRVLITASPTLTNNIIGAWATIAPTAALSSADWASYDSTNGVTALSAASYTSDTWAAGNNTTVTTSSAPASDSTTNTLRFNLAAANVVTLSGVNTISSGGIMVAGAVGANSSTITGGTIQGPAGGELVLQQFNNTGIATVNATGTANAVPGVNQGFLTIGSVIQDNTTATGLLKAGGGQVTLTGANTFTGNTTITDGTLLLSGVAETIKGNITLAKGGRLALGANNQIADTSIITFAGGGTNSSRIQMNGKSETIGGLNDGAGVFNGARLVEAANDSIFNLPLSPLTINTTGSNVYTFGGQLRNNAGTAGPTDAPSVLAITKSGTGTQVLSGTAGISYTGDTIVNEGTLRFTGMINNNSEVKLEGGTVDYSLAGTRSGVISGSSSAGGLVKSGASVLTLTGVNTFQSGTTINAGTLALGATGSIDNTSGVSLGTVGTFDVSAKVGGYSVSNLTGSGSVVGALSVSTQLAIGNSPGTVNFNGDLTLDSATYLYEMTGGVSPGVNSADLGNVTGLLTIALGSSLDLVELGTYTLGNKFTLFSYGTLSGTFDGLANNSSFVDDLNNTWQIKYDDTVAGLNGGTGSNFVTITAVPEPNVAMLLGGLGLVALLGRRRA